MNPEIAGTKYVTIAKHVIAMWNNYDTLVFRKYFQSFLKGLPYEHENNPPDLKYYGVIICMYFF